MSELNNLCVGAKTGVKLTEHMIETIAELSCVVSVPFISKA